MAIEKTADKGIPAERRHKRIKEQVRASKEASGAKPKDYLADLSDRVKPIR